MKYRIKYFCAFVLSLFLIGSSSVLAQSPKREVRATWLSTVWALDWPKSGSSNITVPVATGTNEPIREAARNVQKSLLLGILDKLEAANFNTVFFQVRGMCDAFYNSKYEPWSQYLSASRGSDPGWDPLAFIVEEAHSRGIEVHAWLNPYRYSTSASSHGNLTTDYANAHPDWLLDYGSDSKILNPGLPVVKARICDVVADIVEKYDVDGIVFDDYFYVQGITDAMDNAQYELYNPEGLLRADWRRDNVNQMVKEVQARINSIKPYVTFGISPAGVAASDAAVAAKYGVDPSPVGSDWQYSGIYSDPLAWLNDGSIDYISPQLYWTVGSGNDFSKLSPWWAKISNNFGRHFYSSNTSNFSSTELINEVNINRDADLNGTTGSVYFRTNDLSQANFNALKNNSYQSLALRSAFGWKVAPLQSLVTDLTLSGQNLSWNYADNNVRYTIYAIPKANRNDEDAFTSSKYLQGISYTKSYTLSDGVTTTTHDIAVAVYDRYGNEFSPRILGESLATTNPVQLTYPENNANNIVLPALFTWQASAGDLYYVWELSKDAAFTQPIVSREIENSEFNSGLQANIKDNATYYWRVKSFKANALVSTSEVRSFNGTKFKITTPADASDEVSMTPNFAWMEIGAGANYKLEISKKSNFSELTYSSTVQATSLTVPSGVLTTSTTYYARVIATLGEIRAISERIYFVTEDLPVSIPVLLSPIDGSQIDGTEIEVSWEEQTAKGFQAELSQDKTFPSRGTKLKATDAFIYTAIYSDLDAGTYYLRVRAKDSKGLTEASSFVTVYLTGTSGILDTDASKLVYTYSDFDGNCHLVVNSNEAVPMSVAIYSVTGALVENHIFKLETGKNTFSFNIDGFNKGLYLLRVKWANNEKAMKIRR